MKPHIRGFRATGCHLQCGVTQCYLPLDISEHTPSSPQPETCIGFTCIYPGGMEGRVHLSNQLHTEMVYPALYD